MVNVFLWIVGDVIKKFSYRFVYPGLKLSEKKTKYELLTFLFYGIERFFLLPVQDFLLDPFGDLPNCYFR